MIEEPVDVGVKFSKQVVILQEGAVLDRFVSAFDIVLCLWMTGRAPNVSHVLSIQPVCKLTRHVVGSIVFERARLPD